MVTVMYEEVDENILGAKVLSINYADSELKITTDKGVFCMFHSEDCCENVWLEEGLDEIHGLIGKTILSFEERSYTQSEPDEDEYYSSWHLYTVTHTGGYLDLCWRGHGKVYYSHSVRFIQSTNR